MELFQKLLYKTAHKLLPGIGTRKTFLICGFSCKKLYIENT